MKKFIRLIPLVPLVFIAGCTTVTPKVDTYEDLSKKIEDVKKQIKSSPLIERLDTVYSKEIELPIYEQYEWLNNHVDINLSNAPFTTVAQTLAKKSGANHYVKYQPGMDAVKRVSMSYSGDLMGAYEYLKSLTGFQYDFSERFVSWNETVTKNIRIKATVGANNSFLGVEKEEDQQQNAFGQQQSSANNLISEETKADGYVNKRLKDFDISADIERTVRTLLSDKGKYVLNRTSNTLTVTDKPRYVDAVEAFMNDYNDILTTQVMLTVELIEVSLFDEYKYGVNWNVLRSSVSDNSGFGFSTNFGSSNSPAANGANLSYQIFDNGSDPYGGSSAVIDALKKQGNISVLQHPSVSALSNRMASFESTDFKSFLASSKVLATADVGSTSELIGGVLNDGFVIEILPNIIDEQVVFDLSILFTSVDPIINTIESGGSLLSIPEGSKRRMVQQGVIPNGKTLVLTGYRESIENKSDESFGLIPQSFGKNNSTKEMLVMITPQIIRL